MNAKSYRYTVFLLCLLASLLLLVRASRGFPWDYSINWTASLALRNGVSLYDGTALREIGVQNVGLVMSPLFYQPFTSYIGLPTTAMFLLPFTIWGFSTSVLVYRVVALLAFIGGIMIAGLIFPAKSRQIAWITGGLCFVIWHSIVFSLELGQVDAWIVLLLAISMLAVQQNRWKVAGVCVGIAALLKISPGLLIVYCLIKRQWSVVGSATLTICAGLCLALLPQQGADLKQFILYVFPSVGKSSIHIQNQALGAWLARLTTQESQFLSFTVGIGVWRFIGLIVAMGLLCVLWWVRRDTRLSPIDFSMVILVALLAGPITWDHYTSWAVLPAMLLMPYLRGRRRMVFVSFLVLLAFPVVYLTPESIATAWWMRIMTGTQTIALLGMLSISLLSLQNKLDV